MLRRRIAVFIPILSLVLLVNPIIAQPRPPKKQLTPIDQSTIKKYDPSAHFSSAVAGLDTVALFHWNFEDGFGGPDPQGWTHVDRNAELAVYFHIDDFAGLGGGLSGGLVPLEGSKSLWCGVRPNSSDPELCGYATLPGYGSDWDQKFESTAFATSGNVNVTFKASYDLETGFDEAEFQYYTVSNRWHTQIGPLDGSAINVLFSTTIPADSVMGSTRMRFRVSSDGSFDDQDGLHDTDGALIIDSLLVTDGGGTVDFQDFETEAVGTNTTADLDWTESATFGDFSVLLPGTSVLQEAPVPNTSHVWGFFQGSTFDYGCAGFPSQAVIPYGPPNGNGTHADYIDNEIRSPWVDVKSQGLVLSFDVYRDLEQDAQVFYQWRVRFKIAGCASLWASDNLVWFGAQKDWHRFVADITPFVPANATEVQIGLGVVDLAWLPAIIGDGLCHSQSPLFDNVTLAVVVANLVVTNTNDSGAGSLREALTIAATDTLANAICFDIPGAGPHTIAVSSALPAIISPLSIDGFTQTGAVPNSNDPTLPSNAVMQIEIDGTAAGAVDGFTIDGNCSTIRGLVVNNFKDAFVVNGDKNLIQGCYIGTDPTGLIDKGNTGKGVFVTGTENSLGGDTPAARNLISGNDSDGIRIHGDTNYVFGNLIGLNATGTATMQNAYGVNVFNATSVLIGSSTPETRNVISGNMIQEVLIQGATINAVKGNYIGTNLAGNTKMMTAIDGVLLTGGLFNFVGGPAVPDANVVAGGAASGVRADSDFSVIQGNYIGTDTSGTVNLGGGGRGVQIDADTCYVNYNVIANSGGAGIAVLSGVWNNLQANDIFNNGGLGIDLGNDGVTANDIGDVDSGPNDLLNYPILTSAIRTPGKTTVSGDVDLPGPGVYSFSYFVNDTCDPSGFGEGQQGTNNTGAAGTVPHAIEGGTVALDSTFSYDVFWSEATPGKYLTVLLSQSLGVGSQFSQTSEFSNCMLITNTPVGNNVIVDLEDGQGNTPVTVTFFEVTGGGGVTTLDVLDAASCASLPLTLEPADSICYEVDTDATFNLIFSVCVRYDEADLTGTEGDLRLYHYNSSMVWEDITVLVDTTQNFVCGTTDHFSPFMLAYDITASAAPIGSLPTTYALRQNFPNPFNPTTTLTYDVPRNGSDVSIRIYDITGALVRSLVDGPATAGRKTATWNGRNDNGSPVASGVYFYRMVSDEFVQTRKMVMLK